jgi:hypothetical protein
MSHSHPDMIASLMNRLNVFKTANLVKPLPVETYHVSEMDRALMAFGKAAHIGKIVISYDHKTDAGLKVSLRSTPPPKSLTLTNANRSEAVRLAASLTPKQPTCWLVVWAAWVGPLVDGLCDEVLAI